jgi:membrane protein implicated in regulation of membrane protease activity
MFGLSTLTTWTLLSILLVALEMVVPGMWVVWFAVPAILTGVMAEIFSLSLGMQIVVFAVFNIIALLLLLKFGRKNWVVKQLDSHINQRGYEYIGQVCILKYAITGGQGRIKLGDTYWILKGESCPIGTKIRITKLHLNALYFEIVKPDYHLPPR